MTTPAGRYDVLVAAPNPALDSYYVVPELAAGVVHRASDVLHTAGGKGNNLSRAAVHLGGRVLSVGILGGHSGARIQRELEREGISAIAVPGQADTRQCITVVRESGGENTVFLEQGAQVTPDEEQQFADTVIQYAPLAGSLVLNGSLPTGMRRDIFADVISLLRRNLPELLLALDTGGEALRLGALAGPNIIKINVEEFGQAFGHNVGWSVAVGLRVAAGLSERGSRLLIVTDGPRGAYAFSGSGDAWHVQTPVARWISTAGAGDSFLAGLLLAFGRGRPLEAALVEASAAAAASLQHVVCGQIELTDFRAFVQTTRLERLPAQVTP